MTDAPPDLLEATTDWNGRSTAELLAVHERHGNDPDSLRQILDLLPRGAHQSGASWLLKHHCDGGGRLSPEQAETICEALPELLSWAARLHVLQIFPHLTITPRHRARVEAFLRRCLEDENKFVRAWAYGGFCELAGQYAEHQGEATALLERALADEAPSVRARARRLLKTKRP